MLAIGIAALLIAWFGWWQPQRKAHDDQDLTNVIDHRVDAKFSDKKFDQMASDVSNMKGRLEEISGFLKLLTEKELRTQAALPKSEFDQQIPQLSFTVSVARQVHAEVASNIVDGISSKLAQTEPTEPAYWRAAGELISYRSEVRNKFANPQLPNCFSIRAISAIMDNTSGFFKVTIPLSNCTFEIDNEKGFEGSPLQLAVMSSIVGAPPNSVRYTLDLTSVHVVYHGRPLLPVIRFAFHNCTFEFQTPEDAPVHAKELTRVLLASASPDIDFPVPSS
jgi:hypothetical protein